MLKIFRGWSHRCHSCQGHNVPNLNAEKGLFLRGEFETEQTVVGLMKLVKNLLMAIPLAELACSANTRPACEFVELECQSFTKENTLKLGVPLRQICYIKKPESSKNWSIIPPSCAKVVQCIYAAMRRKIRYSIIFIRHKASCYLLASTWK